MIITLVSCAGNIFYVSVPISIFALPLNPSF